MPKSIKQTISENVFAKEIINDEYDSIKNNNYINISFPTSTLKQIDIKKLKNSFNQLGYDLKIIDESNNLYKLTKI